MSTKPSAKPSRKHADVTPWEDKPADHDYPAAASYLGLIYPPKLVKKMVKRLKAARTESYKAKDIFRASGLSLLGVSNSHVMTDIKKIKGGHLLSPLLLIRDSEHGKVIIADGYHRLCAVYTTDEDAVIPCRIAGVGGNARIKQALIY